MTLSLKGKGSKSSNSHTRFPAATHKDPFNGKCVHGKTKDEKCSEPHDFEPPPLRKLSLAYVT
jgi:hypothetical protein